jgi:hypothetical protein
MSIDTIIKLPIKKTLKNIYFDLIEQKCEVNNMLSHSITPTIKYWRESNFIAQNYLILHRKKLKKSIFHDHKEMLSYYSTQSVHNTTESDQYCVLRNNIGTITLECNLFSIFHYYAMGNYYR